jgi:hypothetical protein
VLGYVVKIVKRDGWRRVNRTHMLIGLLLIDGLRFRYHVACYCSLVSATRYRGMSRRRAKE